MIGINASEIHGLTSCLAGLATPRRSCNRGPTATNALAILFCQSPRRAESRHRSHFHVCLSVPRTSATHGAPADRVKRSLAISNPDPLRTPPLPTSDSLQQPANAGFSIARDRSSTPLAPTSVPLHRPLQQPAGDRFSIARDPAPASRWHPLQYHSNALFSTPRQRPLQLRLPTIVQVHRWLVVTQPC